VLTRPLTREEALTRARLIEVDSYDISLDLIGCDEGASTFGSDTRIAFGCSQPGASTFAEFRTTEYVTALLNGREVEVADGRIILDELSATNELIVRGRAVYSSSGEGLHRSVDTADGAIYLYTMCFLHDASRVFACFDQPDLKAVMRLQVSAPEGWTVISNSPEAAEGKGRFEPTPRLPTYLLAMAAGPYASAHGTWSPKDGGVELPLGLYCRKSLAAHLEPEELLPITSAGLDYYADLFGVPFPFAKFDQLFAPEFNAGAMENAGLVIHMDELLFRSVVTDAEREMRAVIVLHEMAHMWFGDLVTMRWWDDLWLNEAFATYCSYLATSEATLHADAWTTFCITEKTRARAGDLRPSRHPVSSHVADTDAALLNFDAISYNKGASLLRQLAAYVGRERFFAGIHDYFVEHAWGNTDLSDLLRALEKSSGRELARWSDCYLKTTGGPTLRAEATVDPDADALSSVGLVQEGVATDQRVGVGLYSYVDRSLTRTQHVELDLEGEQTNIDSLVGAPKPDLTLANDGDLAYASIRLDDASFDTLMRVGVAAFEDSLPRALCWGSVWDLTVEGELSAEAFVDLLVRSLDREDNVAVLAQLFLRAESATERFAPAAQTLLLRAKLADACALATTGVQPGSGRQLALVRGHTQFASTPEQLARVAERLDGPTEQAGLIVDADLRWLLLQRLVEADVRSTAEIDAEFARDSTAFGRYNADRARASLPDPVVKESAWMAATDAAGDSTNRTVQQACAGFWHWNQLDLCRPYVPRYFAELDRVWRECDTEIAHLVTWGLFPGLFVEPETLTLVDQHLSRTDLPAGQRRIIADERHDLAKALHARERAVEAAE